MKTALTQAGLAFGIAMVFALASWASILHHVSGTSPRPNLQLIDHYTASSPYLPERLAVAVATEIPQLAEISEVSTHLLACASSSMAKQV